MKIRFFSALPLLLLAPTFTSCESTLDYGYFVGELNDQSVLQLFALTDESANNRDFMAYESFFAPTYVAIDQSDSQRTRIYRDAYLDGVEKLFEGAKLLEVNTVVMDIMYSENGDSATVQIQEEEKGRLYGDEWHYTSLLDVELGIEEGWIFIKSTTRTSKQVIKDKRL